MAWTFDKDKAVCFGLEQLVSTKSVNGPNESNLPVHATHAFALVVMMLMMVKRDWVW